MEQIRVLHVIGIMNRGGAEAMIMNLYREIDKTKIQFDFVENSDQQAAYDEEIRSLGGKIYRCPHFTGKNFLAYKRWWKRFFEDHGAEYGIVHGHIGSTAAIYLNEAKKAGCFTIAHSHSSGTDHSLRSALYHSISYPTRWIADFFFACSKPAGIDRYGKKVAGSPNCIVFRNAVDVSKFAYSEHIRKAVRDEWKLENITVVGHIGRMVHEKNHMALLDIFSAFHQRTPNSKLFLVGDGPLRNEIEHRVHELKLDQYVIFAGIRSDVNRLIQAMDVFVFPSLYEGLPVTLVETQTAGLPCVISDKVPEDSILVKSLVSVMKLNDPPEQWSDCMQNCLKTKRQDRSKEVAAAGFDIAQTTKWLEEFYLEHNPRR